MLAGDFNARTGKENDFITDESGKFITGGDIPPPPNLTIKDRTLITLSTIVENNYLIFVKPVI